MWLFIIVINRHNGSLIQIKKGFKKIMKSIIQYIQIIHSSQTEWHLK